MALFSCENVKIIRHGKILLEDIGFAVEKGTCLGISAPSGTGKTSLLRLICELDLPDAGAFFFKGKPYESYAPQKLRQKIGLVAQKPCLLEETVREELAYPLKLGGKRGEERDFLPLLKSVNLSEETLSKKCEALSGGEQQRICLLRALLAEPELLLLDEACASLDEAAKEGVLALLKKKRQEGLSIIFVTHADAELRDLADMLLVLSGTKIAYCGAAKAYFTEGKK